MVPTHLYLEGKNHAQPPRARPPLRVHETHVWVPQGRGDQCLIHVTDEAAAESLIYALQAAITPERVAYSEVKFLRGLRYAAYQLLAALDTFDVEDDKVSCTMPTTLRGLLVDVDRRVRAARVFLEEDSSHRSTLRKEESDGPQS